jgi:hypothetical protein
MPISNVLFLGVREWDGYLHAYHGMSRDEAISAFNDYLNQGIDAESVEEVEIDGQLVWRYQWREV